MAYIYDLTDTWNNAVTSFNGIKLNVTDTTSAVGSKLLNLQISGSSKFNVGKSGTVTATGLIESTSGGFKFPDGTIQTTASAGGGGGSGTVTSVSGTGTVSGLTLTGSVTTSGSLTLGGTLALTSGQVTTALGFTPATAAQGAKADTAVQTIASADGSVTITGTTAIDLSVGVAASTSNVLLPIRNTTGATLTKGTAVYISGATGQISTVSKAIANSDATSAQTIGLITADLANNANGNVTLIGSITNINTSAYTDGQQLYLSSTTAGTLTATKPYAPQHLVYVAVVEHAHPTQGKLFVKVQNGYEMDELHDVAAQSPANNDGLFYNTTTSLWEKKSITTALGYTPYNATNPSGYTANTGTVTSVSGSGGTTGLTLTGGPITTSGTLTLGGTLAVANGGTGVTTSTGTGNNVLSTSPVFTTPNLGTPSTAILTNATGLPLTTGVTGILPVANGGTGVTTSTGSGNNVLSASPTITGTTTFGGTAYSAPSWLTNGIGIRQPYTVYTDTTTGGGSGIGTVYMNLFDTASYNAANGSIGNEVVITNLFGNYFKNPIYTSSVLNSNTYAVGTDSLYVLTTAKFDGTATFSAIPSFSAGLGATSINGTLTVTGAVSGIVISVGTASLSVTPSSTGTITMGRTNGTGTITIGQSTVSQTLSLASAVTASGSTKTVTIGTSGAAGSTTNITVGSTTGTSTTTMNGNTATPAGAAAMTSGFFYIPAAAGAPSGTPTAITGTVPMYYDTTNNRFYIYNGAWKMVTLA